MIRKIVFVLFSCGSLWASQEGPADTPDLEFIKEKADRTCLQTIYGSTQALGLLEWLKDSAGTWPKDHDNLRAIHRHMMNNSPHQFEGYSWGWGIEKTRRIARGELEKFKQEYLNREDKRERLRLLDS